MHGVTQHHEKYQDYIGSPVQFSSHMQAAYN